MDKGVLSVDATVKHVNPLIRLLRIGFPCCSRLECEYCCEIKFTARFFLPKAVRKTCRDHLSVRNAVCRDCVKTSVKAQLHSKPLMDVGCPECGQAWSDAELRQILGRKERKKRFDRLNLLAKSQAYVPSEMPDKETMDMILEKGARLCPWCRWPFIKAGGCDSMQCEYIARRSTRNNISGNRKQVQSASITFAWRKV